MDFNCHRLNSLCLRIKFGFSRKKKYCSSVIFLLRCQPSFTSGFFLLFHLLCFVLLCKFFMKFSLWIFSSTVSFCLKSWHFAFFLIGAVLTLFFSHPIKINRYFRWMKHTMNPFRRRKIKHNRHLLCLLLLCFVFKSDKIRRWRKKFTIGIRLVAGKKTAFIRSIFFSLFEKSSIWFFTENIKSLRPDFPLLQTLPFSCTKFNCKVCVCVFFIFAFESNVESFAIFSQSFLAFLFTAFHLYSNSTEREMDEILSVKYEDGRWSKPYYDCGGGNIWMLTYTVPFFGYENGTYFFK